MKQLTSSVTLLMILIQLEGVLAISVLQHQPLTIDLDMVKSEGAVEVGVATVMVDDTLGTLDVDIL